MRRNPLVLAVSLAALALVVVTAVLLVRRNAASAAAAAREQAAQPVAPDPEVTLSGRIQPRDTVQIAAPITGAVTKFHVEVGDEVYEGQLLAEIHSEALDSQRQLAEMELERAQTRAQNLESTLAAARLEASRASADAIRVRSELDRAARNYERQRILIAEGATPRLTFEKAEREFKDLSSESKDLDQAAKHAEERVASLNRELDAARKLLDAKLQDSEAASARVLAGNVLAPATGIISARRGVEGDQVNPGMDDLFQIATDTSTLDVLLEPDPAQLARLTPGQPAAVYVADVPNEFLPGKVRSVEGGKVLVEFANPSPLVKPGQSAQVRIRVT